MKEEDLTELLQQLPKQSSGILGKEEYYFNSAVAILLVKQAGEYHFLFQQRAADIRQEAEVCFPGGKHDPISDSNYQQTAIRETSEELGVSTEKIEVRGRLDTLVAAMGATVDSFVTILQVEDLSELDINPVEVAEVFTLPVSYFIEHQPQEYQVRLEVQPSYVDENGEEVTIFPADELDVPDRYTKPWGGRRYNIYLYRIKDRTIWGITAQLIREFIRQLDK
ncbi:MAG: NUDIX hydrolase [Bacillota bacterium]